MLAAESPPGETLLDQVIFVPLARKLAGTVDPSPTAAGIMRGIALVFGLSGASLLRYGPATERIVGGVVLLVYPVFVGAAGELDRGAEGSSRVSGATDMASHLLVSLVAMIAVATIQPSTLAAVPVVLGFGALAVQILLADHFARHDRIRSVPGDATDELAETEGEIAGAPGGLSRALLSLHALTVRAQRALARHRNRPPATTAEAVAFTRELGPIPAVWPWLGHSTHLVMLSLFAFVGAPGAYAWLRLTLGTLALGGLYAVQTLRERALDPVEPVAAVLPGPPVTNQLLPLAPPPPPVESNRGAPISWQPPPPGEGDV